MNSLEILKQEFIELSRSQIFNLGCSIGLQDQQNFYKWRISFIAPKKTLYEGGLFFLEIIFPKDYPKNPPLIKFLIPIYHPNVNSNKNSNEPLGKICPDFIKNWKPSTKIKEILIKIYAIFFWPNPDSSYSKEMADEYINNRALYETKAKFFTIKYANPKYREIIIGNVEWDFSTKGCFISRIHKEEIVKYNYNGNEIVNISFSINGQFDIFLLCKLKELTSNVIKRFMDKCALKVDGDILYILNFTRLNMNIPIGDNGIRDGNCIMAIFDVKFFC